MESHGKIRTTEINGYKFFVQRRAMYCTAWDQFTGTNYNCWKKGWVILGNDQKTIICGEPQKYGCHGASAPRFSTLKALQEGLDHSLPYYFNKAQQLS